MVSKGVFNIRGTGLICFVSLELPPSKAAAPCVTEGIFDKFHSWQPLSWWSRGIITNTTCPTMHRKGPPTIVTMTSGWCILKRKNIKLKECWKHWIFPIRSIAWIIGIPIMPYQSVEIKPEVWYTLWIPLVIYIYIYFGTEDPSLEFHSSLFLPSQQTDSHVFSNARKRLPVGITINQHNRSVKSKIGGPFLPSGHHPFHHFSSMILPAKSPLPERPRPKKAVLWFTHTPLTISYFPTVST